MIEASDADDTSHNAETASSSADGSALRVTAGDGRVGLHAVATGEAILRFQPHAERRLSLMGLSPDGILHTAPGGGEALTFRNLPRMRTRLQVIGSGW